METLKIKPKYFMAIVDGTKNYELRHKPIKEYTLNRIQCISEGKELFFVSGECALVNYENIKKMFKTQTWWDEFCDEYCKEKPTYVIEIIEKGKVISY